MKKIHDNINSELIVRTNNVNYRQEHGDVGGSSMITVEGNSTIFTTKFVIEKISYVTVNGLLLSEGDHYKLIGTNTIQISDSGSPLKQNPGLTTTIAVGYHYKNNRSVTKVVKIAPTLTSFTLDKYSGKEETITFNFNIEKNDGKNVYWSILKDGDKTPLFSGDALSTASGTVLSTDGKLQSLVYRVDTAEFIKKAGSDITFTLIVVYDLYEDGSVMDEKIIDSAIYSVDEAVELSGSISANIDLLTTTVVTPIEVNYSVNKVDGSIEIFEWKVTRSFNDGTPITLYSGNQESSDLTGVHTESISASAGDASSIKYSLDIKKYGEPDFTAISIDRIVILVPEATLTAKIGYIDISILTYKDSSDTWRKIGSLGTGQDLIEYNNRINRASFTKTVEATYFNYDPVFLEATVSQDVPNSGMVYFVAEIPTSWGDIDFYQTLGLVDRDAFNKIDLENGYTAYLYTVAPSTVANPSDYYMKKNVTSNLAR